MSVSIAIPIYNAEKYIYDAVQSVLNQTYEKFELILIDDGSTDSSMSIVSSFKDPRIRIISDGKNLGLPKRLNQVVEIAKYDLIARMDADDLIPNYRIEKQVDFMNNNLKKDLVSMGMVYFDEDQYYGHAIPKGKTLTLEEMELGKSEIFHATLMVRKSWYQRNLYNPNAERIEDFELWLRAFKQNDLNVGFITDIGYFYRSDNTLNFAKYCKVYKSLFSLFVGNYEKHSLRFLPLSKCILRFFLISIIFLANKQNRMLSMKNKSLQSDTVRDQFNSQLDIIKNGLKK